MSDMLFEADVLVFWVAGFTFLVDLSERGKIARNVVSRSLTLQTDAFLLLLFLQ